VVPVVSDVDAAIHALGNDIDATTNHLSKGGIRSKLNAAKMAIAGGESVIIANGRRPNVLVDIVAGEPVGTLFASQGPTIASRKRWIGLTVHPTGRLRLDAGAERAIVERGSSLLAIGVAAVEGEFEKGDVVTLESSDGRELARGLINYHADEMRKIAGHATDDIQRLLGHQPYVEVIHRDNLVTFVR
jgi:glutamate 5-kinase